MLVLSRRQDEKVLVKVPGIDREIEVTVVLINNSRVRLGFTAPANVTIVRAELLQQPCASRFSFESREKVPCEPLNQAIASKSIS